MLPHDVRRMVFATSRPASYRRLQRRREAVSKRGYTYRSFDEHECIFVHIPKTAGVSISRALFGNMGGGHHPVSLYQFVFDKAEYGRYFTFSFVRNPWDRLHSAFHFLKRGGFNEENARWADRYLSDFENFEHFVLYGLDRRTVWNGVHFFPQVHFLTLPGSHRLQVDFVGRFERLETDFQHVASKISNVPAHQLPAENATDHQKPDFRDIYSPMMRDIVADVYAEDIRLFGYTFDNTALPDPDYGD